MDTTQEENKTEVKIPVIGKFKPKRKFIGFISGLKGKVRLISSSAFIKGEQLSGMVEGAIFKITICDEDTINFEEVDTNLSSPEMISRFIEDISERDVTGYTEKFVVAGLDFYTDDVNKCYLEVEYTKPIDKLFSIFDSKPTVSDNGLSILDSLFSDEPEVDTENKNQNEEVVNVVTDTIAIQEEKKSFAVQMMEESFKQMNEAKAVELKDRIEKTTLEIKRYKYEIDSTEKKLAETTDNLRVLSTRLESLTPNDPENGWVFFVSQEIKSDIKPDEKMIEVVEKISPQLKLNAKAVLAFLTEGYYKIKVTKSDDLDCKNDYSSDEDIKKVKEIFSKIYAIDKLGKFTLTDKNTLEYRGDLNWHQLVSKMIRNGFSQNVEFDKLSGSNSYETKVEENKTSEIEKAVEEAKVEEEIKNNESCCGGTGENCKCKS